ncbi:MAG: glutamine-hydrolyzing GMP synthase [Bacteroidales bacterium]|nr:glutamine-hydrolyzing GMP synthase [Bacteroidales bacterium]
MDKIIILDNGSQYTQLIARKIREANVYCEVFPWSEEFISFDDIKGIILSGSPYSVNDAQAPAPNIEHYIGKIPILGICYGAQYIAKYFGGEVVKTSISEYGPRKLSFVDSSSLLFKNIKSEYIVWMSHSDTIVSIPQNFKINCSTDDVKIAGFEDYSQKIYGVQFHPEVHHSVIGKDVLKNFLDICNVSYDWTPSYFIKKTIEDIKNLVGDDEVVIGLSGGVDSTVAATLINQAIGDRLHGIFIDTGLLRKNEFSEVLANYKRIGINVKGIEASDIFLSRLANVVDPEEKRKIIGKTFIDIFENEAKKINNVRWLAQGTIYPDVIESAANNSSAKTIKSHHNVGGLPEKLNLKLLEPLRMLFKDEVRKVGNELAIPTDLVNRHPFPGPGLAVRIIGDITLDKIKILQEVDDIYIKMLKDNNLYNQIWQAFAVLLSIKSVGVMGDERSYENVIALRAVNSVDGMTANPFAFPLDFLANLANEIINKVKGVNRVVYDISSKPPATIEWE